MKRLLAVSLLALAMPASGAGQVVRVPEVRPFDALELGDRSAEIGVTIRDIDPGDADTQKAAGGAGVVVEQVRPAGPAATAGVRAADVIVAFDGERVRSSRQFSRLVQETPAGRTVTATIVRDGRRSDVSMTPVAPQSARRQGGRANRDADRDIIINRDRDAIIDRDVLRERIERELGRLDLPEFDFEFRGTSARGRLGVGVDDLTPQLASYFGAKEGVLVTTVAEDTPASKGGLKAGDVIVAFGGDTVRNRVELQRGVARAKADAEVIVGIVRDRKPSDVKVTLEGPRRTTRRQL